MLDCAKYNVVPDDEWSSIMYVRVFSDSADEGERKLLGYLFEIDYSVKKEGKRAYWKMPAEHKEAGENPLETAVRGIRGETGLILQPEVFHFLGTQRSWDRTHYRCLFAVDVLESQLKLLHQYDVEHEGEEVRFFTLEEANSLLQEGLFLLTHLEDLRNYRLIVSHAAA